MTALTEFITTLGSTSWTPSPGKALALRTCQWEGNRLLASHGFYWPAEAGAVAVAPDWKPIKHCGNGLHGLLWGSGEWSLLNHGCDDLAWMVVEINESDMINLDGKVKFPSARVLYVDTREAAIDMVARYTPGLDSMAETLAGLSAYDHLLYGVNFEDEYVDDDELDRVRVPLSAMASVIASEIDGEPDMHTIMLDIDHPAKLIESSTPGHYHLLIDVKVAWAEYEALLMALDRAGVIEPGYASVSIETKKTLLRLPWIKKGEYFMPSAKPAVSAVPAPSRSSYWSGLRDALLGRTSRDGATS